MATLADLDTSMIELEKVFDETVLGSSNDVPLDSGTPSQTPADVLVKAAAEIKQALAPGVGETDPSLWDKMGTNARAPDQLALAVHQTIDQTAQDSANQLPLPPMHDPLNLAAGAGIGKRALSDQLPDGKFSGVTSKTNTATLPAVTPIKVDPSKSQLSQSVRKSPKQLQSHRTVDVRSKIKPPLCLCLFTMIH